MSKPFIKQKLSRKAIDTFALKYTDEIYPDTLKKISYTTADGKTINFTPADAILRRYR